MWCRCHFAPSVQVRLPYWMRACMCGHHFHLERTVGGHSWQFPTTDLATMLLIYSGFVFRVLATVLKPQNCFWRKCMSYGGSTGQWREAKAAQPTERWYLPTIPGTVLFPTGDQRAADSPPIMSEQTEFLFCSLTDTAPSS